jgi:hypothetical protein
MSCVLESSNSPVAWKPACPPIGIVFADGATEMDEITALLTVKFTVAVVEPRVAVMIVTPVPVLLRDCPLAIPLAAIVATVTSEDVQITWFVRFRVPPSLNMPVAVN